MKKFLTWQDSWNLGIESIDRQHRHLAAMLNTIVELCQKNNVQSGSGEQSNQLQEQLNIFYEMVCEHFNDEEALMLKENYPGYAEHAREHLMLRAELKQYIKHIEAERDHINIDSMSLLKCWLISHIKDSDKKFANFLQAHSVDT